MKKCPYCGNENSNDAVVCGKCYAGFPIEKIVSEETNTISESDADANKDSETLRVSRKKKKESETYGS